MGRLDPHFLVPTGDTVYYDKDPPLANTVDLARHHWRRIYSLPRLVAFHLRTPAYWEKDDHDTLWDDCWPGMPDPGAAPLTFADGLRVFREQVPMGEKTWRTYRWGKGLQVWLLEGRDFRSPNNAPDEPDKTIWGKPQKQWLFETLSTSDADWKIVVSPTPIVGPDRKNKSDNHTNPAFQREGDEARNWIKTNMHGDCFIVCGDRHWQYHSVHPGTGVEEFSCGPASDVHAGGSPGENKAYHRFHRVGGGFLGVAVAFEGGRSRLTFSLHDVSGNVVYRNTKEK
jgi:alkaline phosphatase D